MALRRPALLGGGEGSCGPPTGSAGSCACYIDGTRAQGVCGGRVGGAGALPPQRDSGRSDPVRRRRRWRALPRLYGGACRVCTAEPTRRRPRWTGTGSGPRAANGCGPGPFGPSITFSLVPLFVSCDVGDGDEVKCEPVFLLLAGGGAGWDKQMDRSEMLPMMYDSTLGD